MERSEAMTIAIDCAGDNGDGILVADNEGGEKTARVGEGVDNIVVIRVVVESTIGDEGVEGIDVVVLSEAASWSWSSSSSRRRRRLELGEVYTTVLKSS
jgi:hypothetical protein